MLLFCSALFAEVPIGQPLVKGNVTLQLQAVDSLALGLVIHLRTSAPATKEFAVTLRLRRNGTAHIETVRVPRLPDNIPGTYWSSMYVALDKIESISSVTVEEIPERRITDFD